MFLRFSTFIDGFYFFFFVFYCFYLQFYIFTYKKKKKKKKKKKETKKRDDTHTLKGEKGGKLGGLLHCSTLHTHHQNTRLTKTR